MISSISYNYASRSSWCEALSIGMSRSELLSLPQLRKANILDLEETFESGRWELNGSTSPSKTDAWFKISFALLLMLSCREAFLSPDTVFDIVGWSSQSTCRGFC
jgi:hypothetical protein